MLNPQPDFEFLEPLFTIQGLILPKTQVMRWNTGGTRYYFTETEQVRIWYKSVTSAIAATMKINPYLLKWMLAQGENYNRILNVAAEYGTFMHYILTKWLSNNYTGQAFDFASIKIDFYDYLEKNENLISNDEEIDTWLNRVTFDLIAFMKFCEDYQVQHIAIEVVMASKQLGWAGAIDLVCTITIPAKKGKPSETFVTIIDLKSGRKGFYASHILQLRAYQHIWNENMAGNPDLLVNRFFNWSPANWDDKPKYKFKEQTDMPENEQFEMLVSLSRKETVIPQRPANFGKPDYVPPVYEPVTEKEPDYKSIALQFKGIYQQNAKIDDLFAVIATENTIQN